MAFVAISITVLNYRTDAKVKSSNKSHLIKKRQSEILVGDFQYDNVSYAVYGIPGTGNQEITEIDFFLTGSPVSSFTGYWNTNPISGYTTLHITVTPYTGDTPFAYNGGIFF